ncbi:hypothetical protein [Chitinophaga sancti]|uniref:Uncharacterized protein n=1 Tax=Chitinophaga sancti TaxID=1004 RepID=A0A1K1NW85_9BACT|nr:hypothetical protein [Chitinophaga sancti]WQD60234.1 hypothetical protein U0033_20290 [Chitinophaga sancti]WQG87638.1 hypothetical protein SR876_22180 [Chitinophaga sancti]SFW39523.1 hypothetical protein SAMN05661012_01530 [Chitinophaga sancti]
MQQLLPETTLQIAANTALAIPDHITYEQLESLLAARLETMINEDFQQFVLLLYKIDVSENKVRQILADDTTAAVYKKIAALLIERQQQKIISRKTFTRPANDDDGEERW